MINVVIVDDEPMAIQSLSWELTNFSDEINILRTFSDPEDALTFLKDHTPDCLFLDIQMPTMDGFQFLDRLSNREFAVVITTAYDEYAIKALKHEAIDYLLKPIDTDDLKDTISKIKKYNSRQVGASRLEQVLIDFNKTQYNKKVTLNADGKLTFLNTDDIIFVESDGNYSTLFLTNKQKMVVTKKLKEVNAILPEQLFFRIHNSYIVNLNKIKEFFKTEGYVVMESNHRIPVARQRKSDFLEKF
ncbi:MAG: LytTR family DNA-binding domain-containing protein [Bacteroidia bacterium]|nr:LytTR family DNA-binding domain-containing protein [Bacteroidia bacterium]RZW49339.1 MAG: response regulator transcription factor [Flavobacteriaceae bacterium]